MDQTDNFLIVDYSDKSFVIPDPLESVFAEEFTLIGGRYNPRLACGDGWVFSKSKHMERVIQMYAYYGLTDMVCNVSLTDMGVTKQDKNNREKTSVELPEYILTGDKLKEWYTIAISNNNCHRVKVKSTTIGVLLSSGVHLIASQGLQTEFLFGYSDMGQGETREQARAHCEYARTHDDYFIEENTENLREQLARLKNESTKMCKYLYLGRLAIAEKNPEMYQAWDLIRSEDNPDDPIWHDTLDSYNKEFYDNGYIRAITSEERERLIVGYQIALEMQEKRCRKYLKRYGLSKIKTSVYWMDR